MDCRAIVIDNALNQTYIKAYKNIAHLPFVKRYIKDFQKTNPKKINIIF